MAAEDGLIFRPLRNNDSTLVTPYPEAFHVQNDITVSGKADKFTRQLNNALRTREVYSVRVRIARSRTTTWPLQIVERIRKKFGDSKTTCHSSDRF